LIIGFVGSVFSAANSRDESPWLKGFGSNVGVLTSAMTPPSRGSMATTEPRMPSSAFSAARCTSESSVSRRS
jgi:hypothetical protein